MTASAPVAGADAVAEYFVVISNICGNSGEQYVTISFWIVDITKLSQRFINQMKKVIIIGVIIAISVGGYALYRLAFSSASYGSVNVNIGAVDEKAITEICKGASGQPRIVCLADELKKILDSDLLSKLQLGYSVADAQKWSNFPPAEQESVKNIFSSVELSG